MLVTTNTLKLVKYPSRSSTVRLCHCDCGQSVWLPTNYLTCGRVKACGCRRQTAPGRAARNQILDGYKRGAIERGLEWNLTEEEFDHITAMNCFYCGQLPSREKITRGNNGSFVYNGIDRKDNSRGYLTDNIVPCCSICNRAKRAMSFNDFIQWLECLVEYRGVQCGS